MTDEIFIIDGTQTSSDAVAPKSQPRHEDWASEIHLVSPPELADFWRDLKEVPFYLPLFKALVWRTISLRYTQSYFGLVWVVVQPRAPLALRQKIPPMSVSSSWQTPNARWSPATFVPGHSPKTTPRYDIFGCRNDWQRLGKANDLVPVDTFGASRGSWFVFLALRKLQPTARADLT
jgi:hypothetical protein